MHYTSTVHGVVLLSPYLGDSPLISEISNARGVDRWSPEQVGVRDYERLLWRWIKSLRQGGQASPPVFLCYGEQDSLACAHRLFATVLPLDHVISESGGHDWKTWRRLWRLVLERMRRSPCR